MASRIIIDLDSILILQMSRLASQLMGRENLVTVFPCKATGFTNSVTVCWTSQMSPVHLAGLAALVTERRGGLAFLPFYL